YSALFGGDRGLDAAPASTVARDDDLASDVNAQPRKLVVVRRHAVVNVNKLAGYVAVYRISVVSGQLIGIAGVRVLRDCGLLQRCAKARWFDHLEHPIGGSWEQHLELYELCVDAHGFVLVVYPLGV